MSKYIVMGTIAIFWLLFPFLAQIGGITAFTVIEISDITGITSPDTLGALTAFINWAGFYFKALTFSFLGTSTNPIPIYVSIFTWALGIVLSLSIMSVFRGD